MWVEPDTNVPSGEALIRQILYGKRFFRDEFGIEPRTLWLPDVFGYSGSLPQILKKSGVEYFMTQKLSWNTFNTFPHHTFWWQGIDGSRVLAHLPPESTYNSAAEPHSLLKTERSYLDKGVADRCLMLYGIGDGGGGPGTSHLEALKR
jgi:alpha-mannosidase